MPPQLAAIGPLIIEQTQYVRSVIARFGRHPHHNEVLGRISTAEEAAYIAAGGFPHNHRTDSDENTSAKSTPNRRKHHRHRAATKSGSIRGCR